MKILKPFSLVLFFVVIFTFAPTLITQAQLVPGKGYQLQYTSNNPGYSEILVFETSGKYTLLGMNLSTQQTAQVTGTYVISNSIITFSCSDGTVVNASISWQSQYSFTMQLPNGPSYYSESMSRDDTFMSDYMNANNNVGNYNNYQQVNQNTTERSCWCCSATGRCNICGGDGVDYTLSTGPHRCSSCNGTGICKYCNGAGKVSN